MRLFISGPRVFGIRAGVSVGPEDARAVQPRTKFFLPFWTNMAFVAVWLALSAWLILTMDPGPYQLGGQMFGVIFFGLIVGAPWLFLTIVCAILRAGQA